MPGSICIPRELMWNSYDGGLVDLTRLDKEVLGAFIVTDYQDDLDRDNGVAAYIPLEVGEPGEVKGSIEDDEILTNFSDSGNTSHRYFHTHPLGALEIEDSKLEGISKADIDSWYENATYHRDPHWWHMLIYNSPKHDKMVGTKPITSSNWDIEYDDWTKDGRSWYEIGGEPYKELMDMGLEEIDPYEHAKKVA